ncbi:hypothetical protein BDP27DRAFT_1383114 [Rhodocollybia butyracea]|uniref:Uncharacterized protein n=1 Tax=Rhodocollybia butyracea TaxID=206335 RepID=A0A9P5PT92_9AGAR|nr:hypothetical protein BDP27DRAFT_1383114 [Rhodocollybia butyracea]
MALRRLAQTNNASSASPSRSSSSNASPASNVLPVTPRPRGRASIGIHQSPASTPSLSSSVPFDWEAARSRRPPPYATPVQNRSRGSRSSGAGSNSATPARKAFIKKKSFMEKVTSIPSTIAFEMSQFPNNIPLPSPRTSACVIGGFLHFLHLCVRVSQARSVQTNDLEWNEILRESSGRSWFDWTVPMSLFLFAASIVNAIYAFTRIKLYRLYRKDDPVSSPNAKFVDSDDLDFDKLEPPSLMVRFRTGSWRAFISFWRFLLGLKPAKTMPPTRNTTRVQQLEIWTPGDLEMMLFNIYSPVHSLLWIATNSSNWIIMLLIMGGVGAQLNATMLSYRTLLKDKDILHAEVMNEYNEGFVYPRINPIRRDVAVMTHQSEVVSVWDD